MKYKVQVMERVFETVIEADSQRDATNKIAKTLNEDKSFVLMIKEINPKVASFEGPKPSSGIVTKILKEQVRNAGLMKNGIVILK